jgi:hypothetical protein
MKLLVEASATTKTIDEPIVFMVNTDNISNDISLQMWQMMEEILHESWSVDLEKTKILLWDETFTYKKMREKILDPEVVLATILQISLKIHLIHMWETIPYNSEIQIKEITKIWWLA